MPNDYEYLEESQIPPVAPRPPTDAPADLLTGLPNTPALKSHDDVDLESNRPRGNNNLSFSDGVNPKRSEPTLVGTKTSRSSESDEELKESQKSEEERKPHKGGTCWYIFAGVTICLAVLSLMGLGAFLLINGFTEESKSISEALNGTNETTSAPFSTTTVLPVVTSLLKIKSTVLKTTKTTTARPVVPAKDGSTVGVTGSSTVAKTFESAPMTTVTSQNTTELPSTNTSSSALQTSSTQEHTTASTQPTLKVEDAIPIEMTTPNVETVRTSTVRLAGTTDTKTTESIADDRTTNLLSSTEDIDESSTNSTIAAN